MVLERKLGRFWLYVVKSILQVRFQGGGVGVVPVYCLVSLLEAMWVSLEVL